MYSERRPRHDVSAEVTRKIAAAAARLGIGLVALGFLLAAELAVVLRLRGLSIAEYIATRDPVAGTVYLVLLGVFAVAPLLVVRR